MKIILREWNENDIKPLAEMLNNFNIWRWVRNVLPYPYTEADAEAFIKMGSKPGPLISFAIEAEGSLAGNTAIVQMDDVYSRTVEIGYVVAEPYWGKGIGTVAVGLLLEYIDKNLPDTVRVQACVFEGNKGSMRVLEKNGFRLEAIHQKAVLKNGRILDEYMWSRILK